MDLLSSATQYYTYLLDLVGGSKNKLLTILITITICILFYPLYFLYQYRSSIKQRVKEIEKNVKLVKVVRNKSANIHNRRVTCLELDPSFIANNPQWNMISLGKYLSQLQPADDSGFNQLFLQKELEITIGNMLLQSLGKTYGAALLPILGVGSVTGSIAGVSNKISKFLAKSIMSDDIDDGNNPTTFDPLSLDLSLMEIVSFVNLYQKTITPDNSSPSHVTPLEYLSRGENAAGDLAYDLGKEDGDFPTTFDMNEFEMYVKKMEDRILEKNGTYDPEDRSFPPPTPINERLLPGLHLGKGDLKYTHTKREGIEHRLICVLLNKLCHNYYKLAKGGKLEDCFKVICSNKECFFPEELIQALIDCGHTVEVCPRVIMTNFGMQICVKEEDGSFTYIPTTLMLRTGIERTTDGQAAYFSAPHGGMDLNISGPLIGKGTRPAWLQFYVSIGGLCCFHPDEDQFAPWAEKTSLAEIYSPEQALKAIRMCAIVAVTFNRIATEFNLPFGGYGILGMCNDSATIVDFAIRNKHTNAYPLLSTGRYLNHIVNYFIKLKDELSKTCEGSLKLPVIEDILCLIKSTSCLPSDLHISPESIIDMSRRYGVSYGLSIFQSTSDAKKILNEIAVSAKEYLE